MTVTPMDREEELQNLDDFIENSKRRLTSILSRLGWSVESVTKDVKNFVECPFNGSHRVPEQSLDKHLQECQWKAEGYGKHDLPLSIPSLPPGTPSSIKFDEQIQEQVIRNAKEQNPAMATGVGGRLIPRTSDRLTAGFTREERCAMYEYVIANTVEPDIGDDIADMNKPTSSLRDGKTSSYLELLAQERNLKRRRAKYRGVHTNKKSQIEIIREVVNQQMEMLAEYIAEKRNEVSDNPANNMSDGRLEKRYNESWRSNTIVGDKVFSPDNADDDHRGNYSQGVDVRRVHERTSDNRRHDRRIDGSHRNSHGQSERSAETKKASSSRRDSSERRSHKSSHHKRHRHKSKDRHKRRRSRERGKSRSSRDKKKYDDRVLETGKRSHSDDRRPKKRRSRSR